MTLQEAARTAAMTCSGVAMPISLLRALMSLLVGREITEDETWTAIREHNRNVDREDQLGLHRLDMEGEGTL